MNAVARVMTIFIELLVLASIVYTLLMAFTLTAFNLGLRPKYRRAVVMAMVLIGSIAIIFFTVHLTLFYPTFMQQDLESTRLIFWTGQEVYIKAIFVPVIIGVAVLSPLLALLIVFGFLRHYRLWRVGTAENRSDQWLRRLRTTLAVAIANVRIIAFAELYPGIMHGLFFGGAALLFLGKIVRLFSLGGVTLPPQNIYLYASLISEIGGVLIVIAGGMAIYRRYIWRPARLDTKPDDTVVLVWGMLLILTGFMIKGFRIATSEVGPPDWLTWSPVSYLFARILPTFITESRNEIMVWHRVMFHVMPAVIVVGYSAVNRTRLQHILLAPANVFLRSLKRQPSLTPISFETAGEFGAGNIEHFSWKHLLDLEACVRCGRCQDICPAHFTGKSLNPKKVIQDLKTHLLEVYPVPMVTKGPESRRDMITDAVTEEAIWSCTTCAACMEACPIYVEHVPKIIDMRRHQVQMKATFPPELSLLFENMEQRSNPWGIAPGDRAKWAADTSVQPFEAGKTEYLLFVGCAGAFDARNKQVTVALAQVLNAAGVSWGVLGKDEKCCGDSLRRLGNEFVFERIARENVKTFQNKGVTKIITQCPHCYNTLKNDYAQYGVSLEVLHHSELINHLIKTGALKLAANTDLGKIVFHDSCYLGRYNHVYEAPRQIISGATGHEPAEMRRNHQRSFCCGGGGGRMWMEENVGKRINIERVEESLSLDANTVGVCCPYCLTMFEDGLKDKHADATVKVLDVAEIVARSLAP